MTDMTPEQALAKRFVSDSEMGYLGLNADGEITMSFTADEYRKIRKALSANGGEATPYGYLREVDGRVQLSVGPECPPNRSGGIATPWQAIFDHPAPPSVAVPEGLIDEIKREIGFANAGAELYKGVAGEQLRAICIGKSQALQYVLSALTAAPQPQGGGE